MRRIDPGPIQFVGSVYALKTRGIVANQWDVDITLELKCLWYIYHPQTLSFSLPPPTYSIPQLPAQSDRGTSSFTTTHPPTPPAPRKHGRQERVHEALAQSPPQLQRRPELSGPLSAAPLPGTGPPRVPPGRQGGTHILVEQARCEKQAQCLRRKENCTPASPVSIHCTIANSP